MKTILFPILQLAVILGGVSAISFWIRWRKAGKIIKSLKGVNSEDQELSNWIHLTKKNAKLVKEGGGMGIVAFILGILGPLAVMVGFIIVLVMGVFWFMRNRQIIALESSLEVRGFKTKELLGVT